MDSSGSTKKKKIITHISQTVFIIDMLIRHCQTRCKSCTEYAMVRESVNMKLQS